MSRELNEKIAKLKGMNLVPRFSDNIEIAWPLFEELPWPKIITTDRYSGAYSKGDWICGTGPALTLDEELWNGPNGDDSSAMEYWSNEERHFSSGETAPEAICKAWIKWKDKK